MSDGYIRLSRKFFEGAYWQKERTFSLSEAWLDLIQMARFEAEPAKVVLQNRKELLIERGEIHASLRFLAKRWGWGVMQVRGFIKKRIDSNDITQRMTQGETVIKLCNYDKYNPVSNKDNTTDNTPVTHRQHTDNTNNNKDKKEKKEKKKEPPIIPQSGDEDRLSFEYAWGLYGRKGSRKTSESRWNRLPKKTKELALKHIPAYVASTPDEQYRKNFEGYISGERWNDRLPDNEQSMKKSQFGIAL